MSNISDQIKDLEEKVADAKARISRSIKSRDTWKNSTNTCKQILRKKREACEEDNRYRINNANQAQRELDIAESDLARWNEELIGLRDLQSKEITARSEATVNLSTQGKSLEAMLKEAEGEAERLRLEGEGLFTEKAFKSEAEAEAAKRIAQSKQVVFIVVGIVIALGIGFFAYKKLKKK